MITAGVELLRLVWGIIQQVFTHRWSRIAALAVLIFGAGWFLRPRPVAVTKSETKASTQEASFTMGRIGLRIKGGTTTLTLDVNGAVVSIQNVGGELLMVQRTSATKTIDSHTDTRETARTPPPLPEGLGAIRSSRWGAGLIAGIGLDGTPRYGGLATYHLLGPFDLAAVGTLPAAVYGGVIVRW